MNRESQIHLDYAGSEQSAWALRFLVWIFHGSNVTFDSQVAKPVEGGTGGDDPEPAREFCRAHAVSVQEHQHRSSLTNQKDGGALVKWQIRLISAFR
jgi:hypothetical protein